MSKILIILQKTCKIEPKFKVGDWITNNIDTNKIIGIDIECENYLFENSISDISLTDSISHLWSIQDAKDGDVLSFNDGHGNDCIELIKSITDKKIEFWFCLTNGNSYEVFDGITPYTNFASREDATPATEEQRDTLFAKMKDAGYEWDVEKKELREVEQDPTITDELFDHRYAQYLVESQRQKSMIQWKGDNLKEVIDFTGKDRNFDKWFKSFEEYEQYVQKHNGIFKLFNADGSHYEIPVGAWIVKIPDGCNVASKAIFKQNSAWSEEDEETLNSILNDLSQDVIPDKEDIQWLKSFKERTTWKPSDEQMDALKELKTK